MLDLRKYDSFTTFDRSFRTGQVQKFVDDIHSTIGKFFMNKVNRMPTEVVQSYPQSVWDYMQGQLTSVPRSIGHHDRNRIKGLAVKCTDESLMYLSAHNKRCGITDPISIDYGDLSEDRMNRYIFGGDLQGISLCARIKNPDNANLFPGVALTRIKLMLEGTVGNKIRIGERSECSSFDILLFNNSQLPKSVGYRSRDTKVIFTRRLANQITE